MSLKDEQKVMKELNDLLYPKINKEARMPKKKTEKKAAPKKEVKEYQKKEVLTKLYPKMSAGAISRKYGVTRGSILSQLRKHEIKITTKTSPKVGQHRDDINRSYHKKEYLEKQLKSGKTIHGIAMACNTSFGQVKHMVEKHGLVEVAEKQKQLKKKMEKVLPKKEPAIVKKEETPEAKLARVKKTIKKEKQEK
ncbi:unnamed protein product [marine sediment metagenome]|uniref:Uncharacterized protein n=1 Tax=marine sediment metagenome TaxID=412755 RepID=X1H2J6_9ZZZZ